MTQIQLDGELGVPRLQFLLKFLLVQMHRGIAALVDPVSMPLASAPFFLPTNNAREKAHALCGLFDKRSRGAVRRSIADRRIEKPFRKKK